MTTNMSTKGMGKEGEEGKELPADVVPAEDGGVEHLAGGMPLTSRSYQLEMVEESMQKNIIVAMDTGSGKTLIAALRIQAELERCPLEKMAWFCVPTVALAYQQSKAITKQLPGVQTHVLSGKDNCDHWDQKTWTEVLRGTRIVFSTAQILKDALTHAYVRMKNIALLIFDEAHRGTKNHPTSTIMRDWYHETESEARPYILGLTASPLTNNKVGNLDVLESNLNAISRTPKLHREELFKFAHRPELIALGYKRHTPADAPSLALMSLKSLYTGYDFETDPYIVKMKSDEENVGSIALQKAILKGKTWCSDQLRSLTTRATHIFTELGAHAADTYIHACIEKFRSKKQSPGMADDIEHAEKSHLLNLINQIEFPSSLQNRELREDIDISSKLRTLMTFLNKRQSADFVGIVFVQTRAEVAVLPRILSRHPLTSSFAISTFVGESDSSNRKHTLGELADVRHQKTTLDDLRSGQKNLVISTNALEEGIDITACNVVVCFEKPPNLKSFIQRRGRARQKVSEYAIMFESEIESHLLSEWLRLEDEMKKVYEDEMRQVEELKRLEDQEDIDEYLPFTVERTGAKLTLTDAVSHLYHFCGTLSADAYIDRAPIFHIFGKQPHMMGPKLISAKVVLPCSVDASVREARSNGRWKTEKGAKRDACLQAYIALYRAGLVDDHLLPIGRIDADIDGAYTVVEKRPNLAEVSEQVNIWSTISDQWGKTTRRFRTGTYIEFGEQELSRLNLVLPVPLPAMDDITLHWDSDTKFKVSFGEQNSDSLEYDTERITAETDLLLRSVYSGRMDGRSDFTVLFSTSENLMSLSGNDWLTRNSETARIDNLSNTANLFDSGLVRQVKNYSTRYVFHNAHILSSEDALGKGLIMEVDGNDTAYAALQVRKFPKRRDFLHETSHRSNALSGSSEATWLLAKDCEVDNLPLRYSLSALFIPSILHEIHTALMVDLLCRTILAPLNIQNKSLIRIAITASSACEPDNYQRLEFLGDSILKYLTSLMLCAGYLHYHEGILSRLKDHVVSNTSLSRAAVRAELDRFILTKPFTGKKWRPMYTSDFLNPQKVQRREMSTKVLADVVESLIGAAFLDGGLPKAIDALDIFLPGKDWTTASKAEGLLFDNYSARSKPINLNSVEVTSLLGHTFLRNSLLQEALTHPSHRGPNATASYQRLEYLGDAILDKILTTIAFAHEPPIPVFRLHLIRTALVNGDFLGYLCLSHSIMIDFVEFDGSNPEKVVTGNKKRPFSLWQAMRHSSPAVAAAQELCLTRFVSLRSTLEQYFVPSIRLPIQNSESTSSQALDSPRYPWTLLASLAPPKFFSDIIESLLGALWIDTHGSLDVCQTFLDNLGWTDFLHQVLQRQGEGLLHPKEEVGQLADREKVTYEVFTQDEMDDGPTNIVQDGDAGSISDRKSDGDGDALTQDVAAVKEKLLGCRVFVGNELVTEVVGGASKMEIETRGAEETCRILRAGKVGKHNIESRENVGNVLEKGSSEGSSTSSSFPLTSLGVGTAHLGGKENREAVRPAAGTTEQRLVNEVNHEIKSTHMSSDEEMTDVDLESSPSGEKDEDMDGYETALEG